MLDMHSIHYLLGFIGDVFLAAGIAIVYFNFRPKGQTFMKSLIGCSQPVLFMLVLTGMGASNIIEVFRGDNIALWVVQLIIAVIALVLSAFALVGPFWEVRKGTKEEPEDVPVEAEEVEESVVKRSGEVVADTGNAVVNSPENEKGA
jgi:hypothetical protein